jgi:hypothetical protein
MLTAVTSHVMPPDTTLDSTRRGLCETLASVLLVKRDDDGTSELAPDRVAAVRA